MARFFIDEKAIKAMLDVYASEIAYRVELQEWFIAQGDFGGGEDYRWIISNAIKVLNIVSPGKVNNPVRAKERVRIIRRHWGSIPRSPRGLRRIRNKIEHFDEVIEEWFATTEGEFACRSETLSFMYRISPLDGGVFYFLEDFVVIKDVINWVEQMGQVVKDWD